MLKFALLRWFIVRLRNFSNVGKGKKFLTPGVHRRKAKKTLLIHYTELAICSLSIAAHR